MGSGEEVIYSNVGYWMGILKNLKRLSVGAIIEKKREKFDIEANVLLDGEKISIENFNCCTATGINVNILFRELLRRD